MQLPTDTSYLYATPPELQGWLHPPPLRGTEQVPTKENESYIGAGDNDPHSFTHPWPSTRNPSHCLLVSAA